MACTVVRSTDLVREVFDQVGLDWGWNVVYDVSDREYLDACWGGTYDVREDGKLVIPVLTRDKADEVQRAYLSRLIFDPSAP